MESTLSGVGVIDKAMLLISLIEQQPRSLAELVAASGQSRATTHRLATALETHGMLRRDADGRFTMGFRAISLGRAASAAVPLAELAGPALVALRDATGESVQLYVRHGGTRVCIASLESAHGLRTIVPTGAVLPLDVGSGGRVLLGEAPGPGGWIESVGQREAGVASVSAPIVHSGGVVAAISVSGPIERMTTAPGRLFGVDVVAAAAEVGRET